MQKIEESKSQSKQSKKLQNTKFTKYIRIA